MTHTTVPARALIVIPTYNEAETIRVTSAAALEALPDAHLLIVDDASPDGTGQIADRIAAGDPRVRVLHRTAKDGLGRAYLAGFAAGLAAGYPILVEMDADGSHPADRLPALVAAVEGDPGVGVAIGSRRVPGGGIEDWTPLRKAISGAGNAYARWALGIDVRDATAGFRAYRAQTLRDVGQDVASRGYAFQIDMTVRTLDAGWRAVEVPITFRDRFAGHSKMSLGIVVEAMLRVTGWGLRRRSGRHTSPESASRL